MICKLEIRRVCKSCWDLMASGSILFAFASLAGESRVMEQEVEGKADREVVVAACAAEYLMPLLIKDAAQAATDCCSFTC